MHDFYWSKNEGNTFFSRTNLFLPCQLFSHSLIFGRNIRYSLAKIVFLISSQWRKQNDGKKQWISFFTFINVMFPCRLVIPTLIVAKMIVYSLMKIIFIHDLRVNNGGNFFVVFLTSSSYSSRQATVSFINTQKPLQYPLGKIDS